MAPKSSSTGKEKLIDDDEEVLQAVILADSFNKRFRPLTARRPRCLLPICNAPLLDWTFESLALAGVQEIFVVCRSYAEQVKAAIKESKWSKPGSGIKIVPILTAKETFSPGDAMRDIYTRGLVTSDFVLVMGDLVSNIRIDEVVRVHKERRKTNKDAIMTMVVKESGARHRTKARGDSSVFVLDPETSECLYYEPVTAFPQATIAHVPREVLAAHPEIEIRNDLIDCSIDVCSVEVPSLFQDNFDYLDIRRDFVHGILTSDLLMKNIHCYVAKDGYAARVKDTKSYESVSKDILSRWTFPLVPDDNHPSGHAYDHERGNKYIAKDQSVVLARTCKIGNNTLIGSSTHISENAQVLASVIGQNCSIGTGTIISNSYIFDGTVIGSNCIVERSIIGANVTVKDGSKVQKGCLVGDGVVIGPSAKLKPFARLSKKRDETDEAPSEDDEDEDSDLEDVESLQDSIPKTLGDDSNAIVWPTTLPEDAEEDDISNFKNERFMRLADDASDLDDSDDGSESSSSESESEDEGDTDIDPDALTVPLDTSFPLNLPAGSPMAESEFQIEVKQSLERAFAEGHSVENAAVELKTLRMASNVPLTRVREAVVAEIVEKIRIVEGAVPQRKEIASVIGRWGGLIDKIGGMDPVETVSVLQSHCASSKRLPLFGQILAALYQDDIVEEDDIRQWHKLPASKGDGVIGNPDEFENLKKCWSIGAHMIKQFDEVRGGE
ncbi:nucleotide-diphospho-sugar transferase [Lyophyllum atratum]|nr:nucleotide-diphospho-sugar transferase [Lyophyllum atratum]